MGKRNNVLNHYFRNKERFADLFNATYFNGKRIIQPENLSEASEVYVESKVSNPHHANNASTMERTRDIKMKLDNGEQLYLLALENQHCIDYTMPFRCMQYDTMEYNRQINELRKTNELTNDYASWAERLCKFQKDDRIIPIYTLCLYHGEDKWDGPRCMKDMMTFAKDNTNMENWFADYPLRLLCLNEICDFSIFHTENKQLFQAMYYRQNKKLLQKLMSDNRDYQHISADTLEAMSIVLNMPHLWTNREKYLSKQNDREEYNMCQALREWAAEEHDKGLEEGEDMLATLMNLLFADNRIEDAKLAAKNKETRNILYNEYALIK